MRVVFSPLVTLAGVKSQAGVTVKALQAKLRLLDKVSAWFAWSKF